MVSTAIWNCFYTNRRNPRLLDDFHDSGGFCCTAQASLIEPAEVGYDCGGSDHPAGAYARRLASRGGTLQGRDAGPSAVGDCFGAGRSFPSGRGASNRDAATNLARLGASLQCQRDFRSAVASTRWPTAEAQSAADGDTARDGGGGSGSSAAP